jgi:hypothetical protein
MSNKRNRAVLEEDDYVVDEYEYPSDSAYDNSFHLLHGEIFSSHGLPENDGSSSMAPGFSSSLSALSFNDFYANDRSVFIDGVEHQYRDSDLPAENSRIPLRPPFLAASDFQQEWRYIIPEEVKPD